MSILALLLYTQCFFRVKQYIVNNIITNGALISRITPTQKMQHVGWAYLSPSKGCKVEASSMLLKVGEKGYDQENIGQCFLS